MKLPICFFLFLIIIAAPAAYCGQDLDLRLGAVAGAKTPGERGLSNAAPVVDLRYRCAIPLPQSFSILLGEEFSGLFNQPSLSPLPQINYPVTAVTSAGIGYGGFGKLQVRGISQVFSNNSEILFPVRKVSYLDISPLISSYMTQRYKNGADFFWDLPLWRFHLLTDIFYNDLLFDLRDSTSIRKMLNDADLWGNASLAFAVFDKKLWLKAAVRIKDDLNRYHGYDIYGFYAGIEGNTPVFSNYLTISGDAFARWYESEIMHNKGYADRLGSLSHLRLVVKIPAGFFFKGYYALETALAMYKFRSEFAIRKAWMNQSSIQGGFWITGGGLVPRQCAYIFSTIAVSPRDKIMPVVKAFAGYSGGLDSTINFYRSDVGLFFRHDLSLSTKPLLKNLSFNCGAYYRWINNLPYLFSTQNVFSPQNIDFSVGLSNWL